MDEVSVPPLDAANRTNGKEDIVKVILLLVMVVLLGACAPGAYSFSFDVPHRAYVWEREVFVDRDVVREIVVEVPVIVEVPVVIEVPAPPIEVPPYEPPVLPPVEPPVECSVKEMPPRSPWLEKIKCAGSPAQLVPRP